MTELFGGAELGGTKCVLAVAENPTSIIKRIEVQTTTPGKTLKNKGKHRNNKEKH